MLNDLDTMFFTVVSAEVDTSRGGRGVDRAVLIVLITA